MFVETATTSAAGEGTLVGQTNNNNNDDSLTGEKDGGGELLFQSGKDEMEELSKS